MTVKTCDQFLPAIPSLLSLTEHFTPSNQYHRLHSLSHPPWEVRLAISLPRAVAVLLSFSLFLSLFLCFSLFLSYAAIILNISHLWISDCVSIYSMLSSLRLAVWKLCGAAWNIILEGRGWGRCCEREGGREGGREIGRGLGRGGARTGVSRHPPSFSHSLPNSRSLSIAILVPRLQGLHRHHLRLQISDDAVRLREKRRGNGSVLGPSSARS